jgi:hypothetical protein
MHFCGIKGAAAPINRGHYGHDQSVNAKKGYWWGNGSKILKTHGAMASIIGTREKPKWQHSSLNWQQPLCVKELHYIEWQWPSLDQQ